MAIHKKAYDILYHVRMAMLNVNVEWHAMNSNPSFIDIMLSNFKFTALPIQREFYPTRLMLHTQALMFCKSN